MDALKLWMGGYCTKTNDKKHDLSTEEGKKACRKARCWSFDTAVKEGCFQKWAQCTQDADTAQLIVKLMKFRLKNQDFCKLVEDFVESAIYPRSDAFITKVRRSLKELLKTESDKNTSIKTDLKAWKILGK